MKSVRTAAILVIAALVIYLLIVAQNLLLPLVIAICIWFIVNTIAGYITRFKIFGRPFPHGLAIVLSSLVIIAGLFLSVEIIVNSVETMVADAGKYQERFNQLLADGMEVFGVEELPSFAQILNEVDLRPMAQQIGGSLSNSASQVLFVLIYTIFLLAEQSTFPKKLLYLSKSRRHHQQLQKTFHHINASVKTYISIKTFICFTQALLAFIVMEAFGLDFAIFWGFIIFLLNYIPTFGSLIGTVLPTVFAALQFESYTEIIAIAVLVYLVQFVMANFVEPILMGDTLNISTLVVLLSLSVWGFIWGIAGMIFSVPITVIIIIVCAELPAARSVAVILSANGEISTPKEAEGFIHTSDGEDTLIEGYTWPKREVWVLEDSGGSEDGLAELDGEGVGPLSEDFFFGGAPFEDE